MKNWVKPYLLEERRKLLDEIIKNEENKKFAMERFKEEITNDKNAFSELVEDFNTNFGLGALNDIILEFTVVFGSVLAGLPKNVFLKILNKKNLFFTFTPNPGAEVKHFNLYEEHDQKKWDRIIIVTFPYESYYLPIEVIRWQIAHELAHVYAEHTFSDDNKIEDEADEIAKSWGFEAEKKAYDKYFKEHGGGD